MTPSRRSPSDVIVAATVAGVVSGVPSTVHAIATGRSAMAAAEAAGEVVGRTGLVGGVVSHTLMTFGWTATLAVTLPSRRTVAWGAVAGLAISALDLAVADRRFPAITALPRLPQVADHVLFGAVVGALLAHRSRAVTLM